MSATAYMCKRGFTPSVGLDRVYCQEIWHVRGIHFLNDDATTPKWSRSNTDQMVFQVLPFRKGTRHPDPALSGAICTSIRLLEGPMPQDDGTGEAVVVATFDSDRRWGGAFQEGTTEYGEDQTIMVPRWIKYQNDYRYNPIPYRRSKIIRMEPRDATNITETQRKQIFTYVGRIFLVFGIPYIMRSPKIVRIKTNQTILTYVFESSSPVPAFPKEPNTDNVGSPALGFLEEYAISDTYPPTVGVRTLEDYGEQGDPTFLPFWKARLV